MLIIKDILRSTNKKQPLWEERPPFKNELITTTNMKPFKAIYGI